MNPTDQRRVTQHVLPPMPSHKRNQSRYHVDSARNRWSLSLICAACVLLSASATVRGQFEFERPPISYHEAATRDAIAQLKKQIEAGEVELQYDESRGYLDALLKHLKLDLDSQVLVFSKTSLQFNRITPRRPRALYFDDEVYVGWVQGGDVIEIAAVDAEMGTVFYTIDQEPENGPVITRDQGQCLACHSTSRTQGVPGPLVRSVFPQRSGQPALNLGTYTTDHRSPFKERWGGYYVTGSHGSMRHMGNEVLEDRNARGSLDREQGANVESLEERVNLDRYLANSSDVVALMVLEHQTLVQNAITLAHYETKTAQDYDQVMNRALDRPADHVSESTERRIRSVGEKLVQALLFVDEFRLEQPVSGSTSYAQQFSEQGPRDSKGRSLRDFDLEQRMFRYPCSYLIYSPSFDALPDAVKRYVADRLKQVLIGDEDGEEFAHLSQEDRRAIYEILSATKPDLWPDVETTIGSETGAQQVDEASAAGPQVKSSVKS